MDEQLFLVTREHDAMAEAASRAQWEEKGVQLNFFNDFITIIGGRENLKNMTTAAIKDNFIMLHTASKESATIFKQEANEGENFYQWVQRKRMVSPNFRSTGQNYCALLKEKDASLVADATVFVSHGWRYQFLDVVDTLNYYFRNEDYKKVYVWFDLFTNNQHSCDDARKEWWQHTFEDAISKIGFTLMIFAKTPANPERGESACGWENPHPLTRIWCLWELYCTANGITPTGESIRFDVAMSKTEEGEFAKAILDDYQALINMISNVNSLNAGGWPAETLLFLKEFIMKTDGKFAGLDRKVLTLMRDWTEKTLTAIASLETDPTRKLRLEYAIGVLYCVNGKLNEAVVALKQCRNKMEMKLSVSHIYTVECLYMTAGTLIATKNIKDAFELVQSFLEKGKFVEKRPSGMQAVLMMLGCGGVPHRIFIAPPSTEKEDNEHKKYNVAVARLLNVLTECYMHKYRFNMALKVSNEAADRLIDLVGPDDLETLSCLQITSQIYMVKYALCGQADGAERAIDLMEKVVDTIKRKHGENNVHLLLNQMTLASMYCQTKRFDMAITACAEAYPNYVTRVGKQHAETIICRCLWARALCAEGRDQEKEVLEMLYEISDWDGRHPMVYKDSKYSFATAEQKIAHLLEQQGKPKHEISYWLWQHEVKDVLFTAVLDGSKLLKGDKRRLLENNMHSSSADQRKFEYATALMKDKERNKAVIILLELLRDRPVLFLGNWALEGSMFVVCGPLTLLLKEIIAEQEHVHGPEHMKTLSIVLHLARTKVAEHKYCLYRVECDIETREDIQLLWRVLNGFGKVLGPENVATLDVALELAEVYRRSGCQERVRELLKRAATGYKSSLGPFHLKTVIAADEYAKVLEDAQEYKEAVEQLKLCVAGYSKHHAYGQDDIKTTTAAHRLKAAEASMIR